MNKALIIFQKNMVAGKVKTRLAADIGSEQALAVYEFLVKHTHRIVQSLDAAKFLFFSEYLESPPAPHYQCYLQEGADLGARMQQAFATVWALGYKEVGIIGTDCYELDTPLLEQAFEALEKNDAVLGPALDGGYYLLGLRKPLDSLFANKTWSSATVLSASIANLQEAKKSYVLLQEISDIDQLKDIPPALRQYLGLLPINHQDKSI